MADGTDHGSEHGAAFARLLRVQRAKRGLRQQNVADASGISLPTIMRWEAGNSRSPQPAQVRAVCRALCINRNLSSQVGRFCGQVFCISVG